MILSRRNVLILAAHPDDAEFSMGATVMQMVRGGADVTYVAFSPCSESVPDGFRPSAIADEFAFSCTAMGANGVLLKYPVRRLNEYRQDILDEMIRIRKRLNPDLVFIPATGDIHQDHETIHNEGVRAFKNTSVLGYELPWNHLSCHYTMYASVTGDEVGLKVDLASIYKTQAGRPYSSPEFIRSLACVNGTIIGLEYAERFEVIRWIA